jgi:hypothetical protein
MPSCLPRLALLAALAVLRPHRHAVVLRRRGRVASRSAVHRGRDPCRAAGQAVVRGGYRVTLTGHSLGAGTAALLAMLLHAECATSLGP